MDNNQQQNNQQFNQGQYNQQQYNQQQYDAQQQYYQQQYEMQQQYYQQQYEQQNAVQNQAQQYAQQPQQAYQQDINQPANINSSGSNNSGSSNNGNGGKKKTGLIIGIIAALVIIATVIIVIVVKNKKEDKADNDEKTTTESVTTEAKDSTEDVTDTGNTSEEDLTSTEEVSDNVNHDPSNGQDYVPENPVIVDNEVMTIEITNIHHPDYNSDDSEENHYRWDLKVTNNRAKGGIWVNFLFVRYNGAEIGMKSLTPQSRVAKGQTREVSVVWLDDHNWDYDYNGFSDEPSSLEFIAEAEDEDYLHLIAEDVAFYPNGQENVVSDVPDLSGLTPMIDYNGVKFYITRVNTQEEENDTICLKGFVVNDSDLGYSFHCWGDEVEVNGNGAFGNSIGFDLYPHSVHYFQGWMDLPEGYYVYDGDDVEIGMQYEIYECYVENGYLRRNADKLDPVVEGTMFKCIAPAIKTGYTY